MISPNTVGLGEYESRDMLAELVERGVTQSNPATDPIDTPEQILVDGDKYYDETVHLIDVEVFVEEVKRLKALADDGRVNDMRRELANFTTSYYKAQTEKVEAVLKDIIIHAAPDGTQDDGDFVGFYVLPTGPIHRGIALMNDVRPCGDVSVISRYQAHLKEVANLGYQLQAVKEKAE